MKAKLPIGKKSKAQDDELDEIEETSDSSQQSDATDATDISGMMDDEESHENKSLIDKLKFKIQSLQKSGKKASSEEDEEEASGEEAADDETEKKKKRSKIIQYVIGGGLVLFLASDYIFPPSDEKPAVEVEETIPEINEPVAKANKDKNAAESVEPKAETPTTEPTVETAPESPVEVVSNDLPADTTPTDVPADTTVTEAPVETAPSETAPVETAPQDTTVDLPTDTTTTTTDTLGEPSIDQGNVSVDSVDGTETVPTTEENITDQILLDLENQAKGTKAPVVRKEYVAPPDYEYRGRGLVYNCVGKHWACVDAPSYKSCEDNSSSLKYLNKKTECYPFNVYETVRGCESMQNRMVSSSAKTAFCDE